MHLPGPFAPVIAGAARLMLPVVGTPSDDISKNRRRTPPRKRRVRADDSAAAEIISALNAIWFRYRRQLRRGQRRLSMVAVHDLRVQTRRLLVCLDYLAPVVDSTGAFAGVRKTLRKRLAVLGPLRDAQVQLSDLDAKLAEFPEMTPLHRHLRRRANRLTESVAKKLTKTGTAKLSRRLIAIRRALAVALNHGAGRERLRAAYAQSLADGLAALAAVRLDHFRDAERTHGARIALKHLRYGAEGLTVAVGSLPPGQLARLKKCVSALGGIHDIDVHVQRIAKLETRGRLSPLATVAYRAELVRCRRRLVADATRFSRLLATPPKRGNSPVDPAAAIV